MKKIIFVPYTYVDEYNNVIEEIREAEEFSFFKKIKILISTIMLNIKNK
jgi:hypothetical protein